MGKKDQIDLSQSGVFRDENRHTAIRVGVRGPQTLYIPFSVEELRLVAAGTERFEREWEPIPDYSVQRAAERFLFQGDGCKIPVSQEALVHLQRLAGPAFKRESIANDPAPDIPSSTPKQKEDRTMATKKTAAGDAAEPTKKAVAKKADAAPAKKAEVAVPAKKAAPTKKAPEPEVGARGRQPNIAGSAKIKILAKDNPKRAAAAERFALYKNGMTVDEYIAAGGKRADVNWDVAQGFIEVK